MISEYTLARKEVLVTGGTGMIGRALVSKLANQGANIKIASIDKPHRNDPILGMAEFVHSDLRYFENCKKLVMGKDVVFHVAGIKGSPRMTAEKPSSFFTNTMMFNLNMMEAARLAEVQRYLYTSSVGVYAPSTIFYEDTVWSTFPSENDKFAGYAKRMGELQAQANEIEYDWKAVSIVRPANVYGPYDNFDSKTGMVVPSLISRFASPENPIRLWGDGSAVRDFIYADDVAEGMLTVIKQNYNKPVNLGSGTGTKISELASIIQSFFPNKEILWDSNMPKGDDIRVMDTSLSKSIGIENHVSLNDGITRTIQWFLENQDLTIQKYNAFDEIK